MNRYASLFAVAWSLVVLETCLAQQKASTEELDFFEKKIRPVLVEHCYRCHSAEAGKAGKLKGGLQLDTRDGARKGGDSGPAIVPGNPAKGTLLAAIKHEKFEMPPKGKLPEAVIADFVKWVASGAADPRDGKVVTQAVPNIEKGRQFWSFVPPSAHPRPTIRDQAWPSRELDWFVRAMHEQKGVQPVRAASKEEWLRRVTFDLLGLPPSAEEVETFLKDNSADAYAKVVERLLKSEHFGERWARHWLDVARYTDDLGGTVGPVLAPNSFRYRDWVVQAFNADMPYDQFLRLQLAGDLLTEPANEPFTRLAGLGFQGLGQRFSPNAVGMAKKKVADELDDRVDTVTRGLLGLTVSCSRCHDHKFDPIPTHDYYALAAAYNGSAWSAELPISAPSVVQAREDWSKAGAALASRLTKLKQAEMDRVGRLQLPKLSAYLLTAWRVHTLTTNQVKVDLPALAAKHGLERVFLERWVKSLAAKTRLTQLTEWQTAAEAAMTAAVVKDGDVTPPPELVTASKKVEALFIAALRDLERFERETLEKKNKPAALSPEHQAIVKNYLQDGNAMFRLKDGEVEAFFSPDAMREFADLSREQASHAKSPPPEPVKAPAVTGGGVPMRINVRGNADELGDMVPPGFLQVLRPADSKPSESFTRLDLANAIGRRDNPLTARVFVNRVWHHLFGRGLVGTLSNFGELGDRPSHPELLDTLAVRFTENGWSTKWLLREIVLSSTYRLSSQPDAKNQNLDPDNVLLWRVKPRRLDFEAWRDSALAVAGKLDPKVGGPSLFADMKTQLHPEDPTHGRRTLYCFISRFKPNPTLALFDFPEPNVTSERRNVTTIPQQQLFALNSPFLLAMAKEMAARVQREESQDEARVRRAWLLAFARSPDQQELARALEYLQGSERDWTRFCHALLISNEFVFLP